MKIEVENWKEFRVGDILTVLNGKGITKDEINDNPGNLVAVQSGEENNGVLGMIDRDYCVSMGYTISDKPCLTVARSGSAGFVSFQVDGCVVGDSAKILLLPDDIATTPIYLFLQTVLTANRFKYAYGRKVTEDKYKSEVIILPVRCGRDGSPILDSTKRFSIEGYEPDWQFMEGYIKSLHSKPLTTRNLVGIHSLGLDKWKEFKFGDILTILNGKGITKDEINDNPGNLVAVQSGEENNGVLGMIDRDYCVSMGYTISDKPCLTVARSGSAGFVSFQVDGCVVGDSAKILLLPDDIATTPIYLFLQTVLTANRFKYAYGRKVTEDKYKSEVIILPVRCGRDGSPILDSTKRFSIEGYEPDWQFMENYIRSLPYGDRL